MATSEAARKSAKSAKQHIYQMPTTDDGERGLIERMFGCSPDDLGPHDNLRYVAEMVAQHSPSEEPLGRHPAELDQIADYQMPATDDGWPPLPCGMDPEDYGIGTTEIEDFLASLEWWINLSTWIPGTRDQEMLPDIFKAYTAAIADTHGYEGFKALRLYRLYTRHICAAAKKAWPEANFRALLMLV